MDRDGAVQLKRNGKGKFGIVEFPAKLGSEDWIEFDFKGTMRSFDVALSENRLAARYVTLDKLGEATDLWRRVRIRRSGNYLRLSVDGGEEISFSSNNAAKLPALALPRINLEAEHECWIRNFTVRDSR